MIGIAEIAKRLPHRHPMLLIDQVLEVVPRQRLSALKAVTASEPWFRDCPPADPAGSGTEYSTHFPPVLLIESLCQAAALLAVWDAPGRGTFLLGSIADVTIHGHVEPGSVIHHRVCLSRDLGDSFLLNGTSRVDDRPVLDVGQVLIAVRPAALMNGVNAHG